MNLQIFFGVKILLCVAIAGVFLYLHINQKNSLIALRMAIPATTKELKNIQEENVRLRYEVECFENPCHLMEIAKKPEFAHLRYVNKSEIIQIPNQPPLP